MNIQKSSFAPSFQAKFFPNKAFYEVLEYACDNGRLEELDNSLNQIRRLNSEDITIFHSVLPDGTLISNFKAGIRTCCNITKDKTSCAEASFDAINELAKKNKKFHQLFGKNIEYKVSVEDIIKDYTSTN